MLIKAEVILALVLAAAAIVMRHRAEPIPLPDDGLDAGTVVEVESDATPAPSPDGASGGIEADAQPREELRGVMRAMSADLARLQARLEADGVVVEVR